MPPVPLVPRPATVEDALRRIQGYCALAASHSACVEPLSRANEGAAEVLLEAADLAARVRATLDPAALALDLSVTAGGAA